MLNEKKLCEEIQKAFEETLPAAFEQAMLTTFPGTSDVGSDIAKQFGKSLNDAISEPLAQRLAAAIDYYVRNITIYGTLITYGAPTTHTCSINSPSPLTNGKVPNSLGIK